MPVEYLTVKIEDRAVSLQLALADAGQHRAPSIPDLLIAATAEAGGLTVLHLDQDFELIAEITGQPTDRLAVVADQSPSAEAVEDVRRDAFDLGVAAGEPVRPVG